MASGLCRARRVHQGFGSVGAVERHQAAETHAIRLRNWGPFQALIAVLMDFTQLPTGVTTVCQVFRRVVQPLRRHVTDVLFQSQSHDVSLNVIRCQSSVWATPTTSFERYTLRGAHPFGERQRSAAVTTPSPVTWASRLAMIWLDACDVKVQPPLCRVPLSAKNERDAWRYIKKQTLDRVDRAGHGSSISQDDRLLEDDDRKSSLTINQRHALIVRREEKMVLRSWCSVVVRMVAFLDALPDSEIIATLKLPAEEVVENDEPRQRPRYWEKLLQQPDTVEAECAKLS
eukprot:s839_g34.t1